ncbi:MAG: class I SAM-dependent methyltransferase [Alphaproteobacteria bacterium]|nr:class I SAM-dependent methyltransferase [Alphaproteobacteria bacterium]MBU1549455.1 class I SAM-dependent methyltransferase [Alphaproteobacteria bacterium]MBU2337008.1 class I SAM-dependent methyltransferase [Alphaproteobacteria bacterium]MBU2391447.1 class I SAM-dependent methyltransferase [Alphaproteobacteria bacterium]
MANQKDCLRAEGDNCPACRGQNFAALPIPSSDRSVLSDGRIIPRRLEKIGCSTCGLIRHRTPLAPAEVAAIYAEDYALPGQSRLADDARGESYARIVADALDWMPYNGRLLDVGCGSGATARSLAHMLCVQEVRGLDPALPDAAVGTSGKVTLAKGLLDEKTGADWHDFDAVVSINTIEHTPDPAGFLAAISARLLPNGKAVVICPVATPANCELLFFDHLWTLSAAAIAAFAAAAGLRVSRALTLDGTLACFHGFVLEKGSKAGEQGRLTNVEDAARYLAAWQRLDDLWCAQLDVRDEPVQIFGAGQMAAAVRAYAPRTWARAERLVVDNPADAWELGKVELYLPADHASGYRTIVAVNPLVKNVVAERIRRDGGEPIVMPDTIQF